MSYPKLNNIKTYILSHLGDKPTDIEVQSKYDELKLIHDTEILLTDARTNYKQDVYNQMLSVFGTTNSDVALANFETYKLKVSKPTLFPSLTAEDLVEIQTKIDNIEAYMVYRDERYNQYLSDIEGL